MKEIMNLGIKFALILGLLFAAVPAGKASALSYSNTDPYKASGNYCAYKSPITYETKYIYRDGKNIGYVQLLGSAYCHTAWAKIKFYNPAPFDGYANAKIERFINKDVNYPDVFRTCNDPGGNGVVMKGETSCHTPQVWNKDPYNSRAVGSYFYSFYSDEPRKILTKRY